MKKLLLLLMLLPCIGKAQYGVLALSSELYFFTGDPSYGVIVGQNDLNPTYTGGVFWICDTCAAPDSITRFGRAFDARIWKKVSEVPFPTTPVGESGKIITSDGAKLGYLNASSLFSALALGLVGNNLTATITPLSGSNVVSNTVVLPTTKRIETYSGTTNGSGVYSVTFGTPFASAPNVQPVIVAPTDAQMIKLTAVSTTGFTVTVRTRNDVLGLLPTWSNVSGADVMILVTEN